MTGPSPAAALRALAGERVGAAVAAVVEEVFATVAAVHDAAVRSCAGGAPPLLPVLDQDVAAGLQRADQLAVGLGLVVAPRPDDGLPLSLQWWQVDPATEQLRRLEPDLRPTSLGYYEYTATAWFDVPRRTGERHVVGPYVDVHGTGRYVLTFTRPVVVGGTFLGVVGADVPVSRFETHLLRVLPASGHPFLLLNDDDRVVLSTSAAWLAGALLPGPGLPAASVRALPRVPWRLVVLDEGGTTRA